MATFSDDFERANGALGGNWASVGTAPTISGGYVVDTATCHAWNTTLSDANARMYARARVAWALSTSPSGPAVKTNGTTGAMYCAYVLNSGGQPHFRINKFNGTSDLTLVDAVLTPSPPPFITLSIEWDAGVLTAWCDAYDPITVDNVELADNPYPGFVQSGTVLKIADYWAETGSAPQLSADPDVVGNYGACTDIELTGVNTSWTPGTPGSPVFTVDHGTISAQTVNSATSATITYCPGDFLGSAMITDPSTGATVGIVVTSDPDLVPPEGPCPLTQAGADLLNDEAEIRPGGLVLTTLTPSLMDPPETLVQLITWIYLYMRGIVGGVPPEDPAAGILGNIQNVLAGAWEPDAFAYEPVNVQPVKADTDQTLSLLNTLTTQYTDLAQLVAILGGDPVVLSHQDLKTAIDNIVIPPVEGIDDILDLLAAIQGEGNWSLASLAAQLLAIRTPSDYTLGTLVDRIDDRPTYLAMAAMEARLTASIGAVALALAAVAAEETADAASSAGALAGIVALAAEVAQIALQIAQILADLAELKAATPAALLVPPIWPGQAHVTFGDTADLDATVNLPGPMHGVCVSITSCDPGTSFYTYDQTKAWRHIGALAFYTDMGHMETFQPLSFQEAIYVPKTMAVAGGVKLYKGRGPHGTIRPWTITS